MDGHDYAGSFGTPMFIDAVNETMASEGQQSGCIMYGRIPAWIHLGRDSL